MTAEVALRNNIVLYGIGGIIAPFIGIKIIDMMLVLMGVGDLVSWSLFLNNVLIPIFSLRG